jgi:hypothetical protein
VKNELERMWHVPGGTRENHEEERSDSWSPGQGLGLSAREHKTGLQLAGHSVPCYLCALLILKRTGHIARTGTAQAS